RRAWLPETAIPRSTWCGSGCEHGGAVSVAGPAGGVRVGRLERGAGGGGGAGRAGAARRGTPWRVGVRPGRWTGLVRGVGGPFLRPGRRRGGPAAPVSRRPRAAAGTPELVPHPVLGRARGLQRPARSPASPDASPAVRHRQRRTTRLVPRHGRFGSRGRP